MYLLDCTLESPESNLALDAALLDWCQRGSQEDTEDTKDTEDLEREVLRFWEPKAPMVVIGRSSRIAEEVDLRRCAEESIPVLRRASGGASIVTGPGCLMYAVVLDLTRRPELKLIDRAHAFVRERMVASLKSLAATVEPAGTSDLAVAAGVNDQRQSGWRKFSGNSLRVGKRALLYHGTLLYDFDLSLVGELLLFAPRQPEYRNQRSHRDFVDNLPVSRDELKGAIAKGWGAAEPLTEPPLAATEALVVEQYGQASWHQQR